jgi:hypothetical protein
MLSPALEVKLQYIIRGDTANAFCLSPPNDDVMTKWEMSMKIARGSERRLAVLEGTTSYLAHRSRLSFKRWW